MNLETAMFLLKISGTIIMVALSAIAFFLIPFFKAINKLTIAVTKLEVYAGNQENNCSLRHTSINDRLNKHDKQLEAHEKVISIIKHENKIE